MAGIGGMISMIIGRLVYREGKTMLWISHKACPVRDSCIAPPSAHILCA